VRNPFLLWARNRQHYPRNFLRVHVDDATDRVDLAVIRYVPERMNWVYQTYRFSGLFGHRAEWRRVLAERIRMLRRESRV
jgi:hypothetical protein